MIKKISVSGESLVEILVAISILSIMLASTFSLLGRAMASNVNVTQRVAALNIAREGIEGVRTIRATNWLKYSGAIREKWLCFEEYDDIAKTFADCYSDSFETLASGEYQLSFVEQNGQPRYFLNFVAPPGDPTLWQLHVDAQGRYTHSTTDEDGNPLPLSAFSRIITLEISPTQYCGPVPCDTDTQLRVISSVRWQEATGEQEINLETVLFDFLNRTKY